jgi:signal transduction histidine kinase
MGFNPGGLARYRKGRWEAVREGVPAGWINSLLVDRQGRLWVGSSRAGVARIDDPAAVLPRFSFYLRADRLRSDQIVDLAEDASGRIYIAGGRGVVRLDPATDTVLHLGADAGLPPGETREIHCDRKGAIWFGSNAGLARSLPAPDPAAPPAGPAIREVRVSGVNVLVSDEGEAQARIPPFPAGRGSIEIGFGSVDFSVGNRLRYRYRLLPVESEWRKPASQRSVHYAGLGPNSYRFEVQAVGSAGEVSAAAAAVDFRVEGPFWTSWWFLLLAGASAGALLHAWRLIRLRHLLAVEKVRSRLAADLHDDLGSGLAEIAILTEVARQRDPSLDLDSVAQRARELRGGMSDLVWSVDPSVDNLEGLVNRWRQTAFTLLGDDRLEFLTPPAQETRKVSLPPDQRRQLLLFFKEVAANVARHAGARRVRVTVRHTPPWLELEIRDDGCGFDPDRVYPGYGLKSLRQRAEAVRGQLRIESRPGAGTTVCLKVPL